MKSLQAGSPRIDDKHIAAVTTREAAVAHHPQNVRMAAYEYVGTIAFDELERVEVIVPRIASDMASICAGLPAQNACTKDNHTSAHARRNCPQRRQEA